MIPTIPYLRLRRATFRKSGADDPEGLFPTHQRTLTLAVTGTDLIPHLSDAHYPLAPRHDQQRLDYSSLTSQGGHDPMPIPGSKTLREHYEATAQDRRRSRDQLNNPQGAAMFGGHTALPTAMLHYYHHNDPDRPGLAVIPPSVHARLGAASMAAAGARGEPLDQGALLQHARMYWHTMADRHIYAPPVHELARQMIARHPEAEHAGVALGNIIMPVRLGDLARGNRHLLEGGRGGVTGFGVSANADDDYIAKVTNPHPPAEVQGFGLASHPAATHLWTAHPGSGMGGSRSYLLQVPHAAINDQPEDRHRQMSQHGGLSFDAPVAQHQVTDVTNQMKQWATSTHHEFAYHHFAPRHYGGSDED